MSNSNTSASATETVTTKEPEVVDEKTTKVVRDEFLKTGRPTKGYAIRVEPGGGGGKSRYVVTKVGK